MINRGLLMASGYPDILSKSSIGHLEEAINSESNHLVSAEEAKTLSSRSTTSTAGTCLILHY